MNLSYVSASALLLALSCTTSIAQAEPSKHLAQVGINLANGHAEHDFFGLTDTESDVKSRGFSLAYSRYFPKTGNQLQFSASRRNVEFDDIDSRGHFWGAEVDWKITLTKTLVKPYVSIGMGYQDFNSSDDLNFADDDLSGLSFNLGAGLIADISDTWRLDLGYQRKAIWSDDNLAIFVDSETRLDEVNFTVGRFF